MCGQSVWERLKRLGHQLSFRHWEDSEIEEVRSLVANHTISEIAESLGRPYGSVASLISDLGIGVRYGNRLKTKTDRGKPIGEPTIRAYWDELRAWDGSARQFCRHKGIRLERLVIETQRYMPGTWEEYVKAHSSLESAVCPQCLREFAPMTRKQQYCSRKCATAFREDHAYFGGKRSTAIGMRQHICQLCGGSEGKRIAAHHVFGRENDPRHEAMIALCNGCHHIVGTLAAHPKCDDKEFWENLIIWASMRKHGHEDSLGYYAEVCIEALTPEDLDEPEADLQMALSLS